MKCRSAEGILRVRRASFYAPPVTVTHSGRLACWRRCVPEREATTRLHDSDGRLSTCFSATKKKQNRSKKICIPVESSPWTDGFTAGNGHPLLLNKPKQCNQTLSKPATFATIFSTLNCWWNEPLCFSLSLFLCCTAPANHIWLFHTVLPKSTIYLVWVCVFRKLSDRPHLPDGRSNRSRAPAVSTEGNGQLHLTVCKQLEGLLSLCSSEFHGFGLWTIMNTMSHRKKPRDLESVVIIRMCCNTWKPCVTVFPPSLCDLCHHSLLLSADSSCRWSWWDVNVATNVVMKIHQKDNDILFPPPCLQEELEQIATWLDEEGSAADSPREAQLCLLWRALRRTRSRLSSVTREQDTQRSRHFAEMAEVSYWVSSCENVAMHGSVCRM